MKKLLLILLCLPMIGFGQQTFVPDDAFEQKLIDLGFDNILDNYVTTSSIDTITNLNINGSYAIINGIYTELIDVTGIEDFTMLSVFDCSENDIIELDLSNNLNLTSLNCLYNELICLNLKNGNNYNMIPMPFIQESAYNANLTCIEVDDTTYSNNNWSTSISTQIIFSNNCNNACSSIISEIKEHTTNKELLKVTDLLGRETPYKRNTPLFYIYDDGTVEKRIVIE